MKNGIWIFMCVVLLVFVFTTNAQNDWKTKDFDKWDTKDVETILNKSDWVKKQEVRLQYEATQLAIAGARTPQVSSAGGGNSSADVVPNAVNSVNQGSIQPSVDFTFTLRLRSSLAIRLALIRKMQLETNVEKISNEEFELYKKRQIGLYQCPACAENYVLTLTSVSKENKNFDAVFSAFSKALFNDLKRYIFLQNDKGEKRELVNFVAPKSPGDEAIFFFPRFDEKGNPLFTKENKYMIFVVTNNIVNSAVNFKIEIAPIVVADKVDF
jgi:hypothetical protein